MKERKRLMVIITLILIIAILLIIHKNKKFKTIEECNKFLYNCKNKQRYIQVLKERANLYEEQENYSAAVGDFLKVLEYYSQSKNKSMIDNLYEDILTCYEELKQYNQVVAWSTKIIHDDTIEVSYDTYYRRACAYKELGEEAKAQADFKKTIELFAKANENHKDTIAWEMDDYLTRSKCYSNLGMYDNALEDIESAIKCLESIYPEFFYEKYTKDSFVKYNEDEKAIVQEDVLKLFEQLLNIQLNTDKLNESLKTCEKLIFLNPENQTYTSYKNEILEKLKTL